MMGFSSYLKELFDKIKLIVLIIVFVSIGVILLGHAFISSTSQNYGIKQINPFLYYPSIVLGILFMIIGFVVVGYYKKKYPETRRSYNSETRFPREIHVRTTSATEERDFQRSIPTLRESLGPLYPNHKKRKKRRK